jgi:metallophosphoesterase superfamily enzyme
MNSKLEISWNARKLSLLADRAIHLASENVLFIADPHFGKAATFRKSGIPVPEKSTQEDCDRLAHLINETKVDTLVILGDFFTLV